ncbi:protein DMP6-like [Curcuma longa]|uniref:protein DMP6-like n=1 Tax=Curcuma longa TaxID=136217 RepID=UPI003D9E2CE4
MATHQEAAAAAGGGHRLLADDNGRHDLPPLTALQQVYKNAAHLANFLPTGTALAFHVLAPVLTDDGRCPAPTDRAMTAALLLSCALSAFLLTFTDSFHDPATGHVRYGFATARGLLVIDGHAPPPPGLAARRRLAPVDFVHAFTTVLVFAAVAISDHNVVSCFRPNLSGDVGRAVAVVPMAVGFVASAVFVAFPTTRHGIGYPVTQKSCTDV